MSARTRWKTRWLALTVLAAFGSAGFCSASEYLYQFSGMATALDGSSITESFLLVSAQLITADTTRSAGELSACSISNDLCSYVSLFPTGPGDPAGHPEVEVGGFLGAYDYYFPFGSLAALGTHATVDLGTGVSGQLNVSYSNAPEPSTYTLLLLAGELGCAVLLRRKRKSGVIAAAALAAVPLTANAQNQGTVLDYTTSWVGNSFGGGNEGPNALMKHVPLDIDSIYVTPDGKVYSNTSWDEGGRALSTFANGDIVNPVNQQNENNGGADAAGGLALAVDDKYIYEAYSAGSGVTIKNIGDHTNTGLSLTGSSTVANSAAILGMAVAKGKLYLTENDVNKVEIFDTVSLALVGSFPVAAPARLALDSTGAIWISHTDQTVLPFQDDFARFGTKVIDRYDASGRLLSSLTVQDDADVTAIWIDAQDRLFVGDDGVDQNVKVYAHITKDPVLMTSFGARNGIYAGSDPGELAPMRFHGITGVGTDALGNIYVAQNGLGPAFPLRGSNGRGTYLQVFTPGGKLEWSLNGLEFVTMGGFDPENENEFFDAYHRFTVDYSQPPGKEAKYVADTTDPSSFPRDIRLTKDNGFTSQIQYIQGRKFLFVTSQAGGFLAIFRYDPGRGEMAIPCGGLDYGAFLERYNDWDYQPMNGEFIWRDLNGNGATDSDEFLQPANTRHVDGQVWWPDTNGDIWQIAYYSDKEQSIHFRRYRFQGFDRFGAPIYDYAHVDHYDVPSELTDVDKLAFFPNESAGGTLFLGGSANGTGAFTKMARYDHWDQGNRKAAWVTTAPWDPDPSNTWAPNSFAVTGDYMFVDFWIPHFVEVYSSRTGQYVGRIQPGDNVGGPPGVGNTDTPQSIEAYLRPTGEYLISQEEDYQAKILLYRWTPPATLPVYTPPPSPTGLHAEVGELTTLTWSAVPNALNYTLWRSDSPGGSYTVESTGITMPQTYLPSDGLTLGKTYYYRVSDQTETGLSGTSSPIGVQAVQQGTIYPAANANFTSPAFTVGCPPCFGGQRVGNVAPGVSITFSNVSVTTAGTYSVRLYYVNGNNPWSTNPPIESPTIDYAVNNGAAIVSPPLAFTGDWNTPGYVTIDISLNAGNNTIILSVPADAPTGTADIAGLLVAPSTGR